MFSLPASELLQENQSTVDVKVLMPKMPRGQVVASGSPWQNIKSVPCTNSHLWKKLNSSQNLAYFIT